MDTFSPEFLSLWFKIFIVMSVVWFTTKILRHRFINKTIIAYIALPDERKERIIRLYRSVISTWRIFLRLGLPLMLILLIILVLLQIVFAPYLIATDSDLFRQINQITPIMALAFAVACGHMLEDSFYKKKILKALEESRDTHLSTETPRT